MSSPNIGKKCFVLGDAIGPNGKTVFGVRMEGIILNEDDKGFWVRREDGHERRYRRSKVELA
jgi:hypothetical protein